MTGNEDIRSPFKFLDPYTRSDQDIFFGRDEEVEKLYESVNKNRLVLVYGQSGTGKTSLVQCGLANRFEVTDWMPFFIRRGADINASLCQALSQSKAIGGSDVQPEQVPAALGRISDRYVRPVYLIFDQFEELMILGEPAEIETFTLLIRDIIEGIDTQSTYLLFILREEYFGWLDEFERIVPGFSDRRLRVEPMRPAKLEDVIMQTCASFNVTLEKGRENARQIIDSLRSKGGISLPYLQVYLDMLWREDYQRTDLTDWNGQGYPPLEFTTQEIESFGNIEDVLGRFLEERKAALQAALSEKFPDFPDDGIPFTLDAFVTDEGTKRPLYFRREEGDVIHLTNESAAGLRNKFTPEMLTVCLEALEQSRLLRADEDSFELAHDSLAALIDQQRSDEQKQLNRIRARIRSAYHEFQVTGEYLTEKQLNSMEDFFPRLALDTKTEQFINDSVATLQQQKKAEKEAQERKLQEQKDRAAKEQGLREEAEQARNQAVRNARRSRVLAVAGFVLFFLALGGVVLAYSQSQVAKAAREEEEVARKEAQQSFTELKARNEEFRRTNYNYHLDLGQRAMDQGKYDEAINNFAVALTFDSLGIEANSLIQICRSKSTLLQEFKELMQKGDQAFQNQDYLNAMRYYFAARNLNLGGIYQKNVEIKIGQTSAKLLPELKTHLENADAFLNANRAEFAQQEVARAETILLYLNKNSVQEEINQLNRLKRALTD